MEDIDKFEDLDFFDDFFINVGEPIYDTTTQSLPKTKNKKQRRRHMLDLEHSSSDMIWLLTALNSSSEQTELTENLQSSLLEKLYPNENSI